MSIESRSQQYGKVFDHWQIKEFLGSGSGGNTAVFRLVRIDSDWGESALKVVSLIAEPESINACSAFRRQEYESACAECSRAAEQEVQLMDELRGNTNIVDYLDHTFVDWSDETGFGRDLLIRMELLTDLRTQMRSGKQFSEAEIQKIGRDICSALVRCHRKNILHRDVKPGNIFCNKDGDYKLGDFGVSRVLDARPGSAASTGIGTYGYWPAEQMTGHYDKRVDIYSLGLVLYELSNRNRLPFAALTYATSKDISLRLSGAPIPPPSDASPAFAAVILKACAFKPEERYRDAEAFLQALEQLQAAPAAQGMQHRQPDFYATAAAASARKQKAAPAQAVPAPDEQTMRMTHSTEARKAQKKKPTNGGRKRWLGLAVIPLLCAGVFLYTRITERSNNADPGNDIAALQAVSDAVVQTELPLAPTEALTEALTEPTQAPTEVTAPPRTYQIGEEISFGTYEQNNDPSDGTEDIQWIVLKQENDRVMLISKYCLDAKPYNSTLESVDWAHCSLRAWLNDEFFDSAFMAEEQARILTVTNENPAHDLAQTSSGESTADRVSILSREEAEDLFKTVTERITAPTAYARAHGAHLNTDTRAGWWWLRTTSFLNDHVTYVTSLGGVSVDGRAVNRTDAGVRPVIWISTQ